MRECGMEEGKAGKWRNEGGEADIGRARSEGGMEGREGDAGRGEHGVNEGGQGGR